MYDNKFKDSLKSQILKLGCSNISHFQVCFFFLWWGPEILHETDVVHSNVDDSSSQAPIIILTVFVTK